MGDGEQVFVSRLVTRRTGANVGCVRQTYKCTRSRRHCRCQPSRLENITNAPQTDVGSPYNTVYEHGTTHCGKRRDP